MQLLPIRPVPRIKFEIVKSKKTKTKTEEKDRKAFGRRPYPGRLMVSYFFLMHTIDVVVTIRTITSPATSPTMMNNTMLSSFAFPVFAVCKNH